MSIERSGIKARVSMKFGLEYGVCSIVAAEANKHAYEMADAKNFSKLNAQRRELLIVDQYGANPSPVTRVVINIASVTAQLDAVHNSHADLVMMLDDTGAHEMANGTNGTNRRQYEPRLAVIVDENIALELARFDSRTDGNCRHIQLGPEITEDSLVVTQDDERIDSTRARRVQAIKDVLENCVECNEDWDYDEDTEAAISGFIKSEILRNKDAIAEMRMPSIYNKFVQKHAFGEHRRTLNLYKDSGAGDLVVNTGEDVSILIPRLDTSKDDDARSLKIALTQSEYTPPEENPTGFRKIFRWLDDSKDSKPENPNPIKLVAIVRDSIAIDLATFAGNKVYVADESATGGMRLADDTEVRLIASLIENPKMASRKAALNILNSLDTESKIDSYIGKHVPKLEEILRILGKVAAKGPFKPEPIRIDDVELGSTTTDALLDVTIDQPENGVYALSMKARPLALDNSEAVDIFDNLRFYKFRENKYSESILDEVSEVLQQTDTASPAVTEQDARYEKIVTASGRITERPAWWSRTVENRRKKELAEDINDSIQRDS